MVASPDPNPSSLKPRKPAGNSAPGGASRAEGLDKALAALTMISSGAAKVTYALAAAGYSPVVTGDPQQVSRLIQTKKPRLVLLDLMLPEIDGIELMESIPEMADLPVLFISGYGRDETIARALEAGASDYIVKPFSPTELVARVRAALRRGGEPPESFLLGELAIDYEERRVTVAGRPVQLTAKEDELLRVLSVNAGRVTTYDFLLRQVWSQLHSGDSRPVRTLVKKLRRKLGDDAANPSYIFSERSLGYTAWLELDKATSEGPPFRIEKDWWRPATPGVACAQSRGVHGLGELLARAFVSSEEETFPPYSPYWKEKIRPWSFGAPTILEMCLEIPGTESGVRLAPIAIGTRQTGDRVQSSRLEELCHRFQVGRGLRAGIGTGPRK